MLFEIRELIDFNIIASLCFPIAAWRWGDWVNWKSYYPTILFFMLVNFIYGYLTYNHPLWEFESPLLKTTLCDVFVTFVAYPSTILLFLPRFPKKLYKQIIYVLAWVLLFSMLEVISFKMGYFSHNNGWTIWWSVLFNCVMFPILHLHHQKPISAWIITFILAILFLVFFKVPFASMK